MSDKFAFSPAVSGEAAMALGLVRGVRHFSSFGPRFNLTNDTEVDLQRSANDIIPFPNNNGEALEIVSTEPGDNTVVSMMVLGPGGVFNGTPVTVTLNGTTPVAIPGLISRINGGFTGDVNGYDGSLIIRQAGGGTTFATWDVADQTLNQGRYTIPKDTKATIGNLIGTMQKSGGNNSDVLFRLKLKGFEQNKFSLPFGFGLQRDGDTSIEFVNRHPQMVTGPSDIKVTGQSSSTGTGVAAFFSGMLFDV